MSDLVSGVLRCLAELEEAARNAMQRRWLLADNYIEDENGAEVATFSLSADAHLAAFAAEPESVLRLCRAHRQIVEAYREAQGRVDRFPEEDQVRMREAYLMVRGYAQGLRNAVRDLAVGLGVVEEDRNGE